MLDELLDEIDEGSGGELEGAVIGIDLGTTNSVVYVVVDGRAVPVADSEGLQLLSSTVAWMPDGTRMVGADAKARRVVDPGNTVFSAKRLIGQAYHATAVQRTLQSLPYRVCEGERQEILIATREGNIPVAQVSAYVLDHLKTMAERYLGCAVTHCVVTVPANFSDTQRAATRQAAALAGMEVLRILNEPTAAAIAYGQGRKIQQRIAVFDLGGGTFDISVLTVRNKLYEVIATGGDSFLGGDDIDQLIYQWLAGAFLKEHRIDPDHDPVAKSRLLMAAEQIKHSLSDEEFIEGTLSDVMRGSSSVPLGMAFSLSRDQLETMIAEFAQATMDVTDRVLGEAELAATDIDEVILVGGSTCIPLIRRLVEAKFGKVPSMGIDPMRVVAMGAAMQADRLVHPVAEQSILLDVTPHSLRIGTVGGYSRALITKNTTIPAEGIASFFTAKDNQTSVTIRICQGEKDKFDDNVPLGEVNLNDLPEGTRGEVGVLVAFTIDADGILQVSAKNSQSDSAAHASLSLFGLREER